MKKICLFILLASLCLVYKPVFAQSFMSNNCKTSEEFDANLLRYFSINDSLSIIENEDQFNTKALMLKLEIEILFLRELRSVKSEVDYLVCMSESSPASFSDELQKRYK